MLPIAQRLRLQRGVRDRARICSSRSRKSLRWWLTGGVFAGAFRDQMVVSGRRKPLRPAGLIAWPRLRLLGRQVLFIATVSASLAATDNGENPNPQAMYADFVVKLTRFVTWPEAVAPTDGETLVIGTFARDPINAALDAAAQREREAGYPVSTRRLASAADAERCAVVFMSAGAANVRAVLERVRRRPVLTVSDAPNFVAQGGHVEFLPGAAAPRLKVSAENLRLSGLEARAQLLRLAGEP